MPATLNSNQVTLTLPSQSSDESTSAKVALHGATVYSYKSSGVERLFVSSKSDIAGPAAIRGGIPVCWPVFGPPPAGVEQYSKLKQHGFARTSTWSFSESESGDAGDSTKAVFKLEPTSATEAVFSPAFSLTYTVTLSPTSLTAALSVQSPSSSSTPLKFQALLHSYFRLPSAVSPPQVLVTPLEGLKFVDKVQGGAEGKEERKVVDVEGPKGEVDRVYFGAPNELEIKYSGAPGGLKVTKEGLADAVLWNPGAEKGATIGDMEEGGAGRYVCLEPGQVGEFVTLQPGEDWTGSITISATD